MGWIDAHMPKSTIPSIKLYNRTYTSAVPFILTSAIMFLLILVDNIAMELLASLWVAEP